MQPHTLFHKNSCNACGNFIVVTKQEILVISFTDCCFTLQIRKVSGNDFVPAGQWTSTPRRARATVELLRQETPNFLASNLWPPNSPDLGPVDYEIWAVVHHRVYHRQIHSVDELKRRLSWCSLEQSIFEEAIEQWWGRHRACVHAKKGHLSTACEYTVLIWSTSVTLNVTRLTVASVITKSCQQRWWIHSCSVYKVV